MKKNMPSSILGILFSIMFLLAGCATGGTGGTGPEVSQPVAKRPQPPEPGGCASYPAADPCWLVDVNCKELGKEIRPVLGISDELYSEKRADEDSLEGAVNKLLIMLGGYMKQTLKEAGASDIQAGRVVGDAVVADNIRKKVREQIRNETWQHIRHVKCRYEWTGEGWRGPLYKQYSLVGYVMEDKNKIVKEVLVTAPVDNEEVKKRALKLLESDY